MDNNLKFQQGQILFLECGDNRLYVELIQLVVSRQLCWVRPLLLVNFAEEAITVSDLRNASDLLWSLHSFQAALDTEVVEFLSQVLVKEAKPELERVAKQKLNEFIQKLWLHIQDDSK
ncbi:hypothetical protein [Calothrix sp. UHCC 0171]|uniref:hypothetical protein n=1 Tax=Calothrix sp. UHCC 0171 TaxID=3110245 RepID=UPI002B21524C|nr:hypothetical protein [Calothrix sp. UHCC 0171]MEA5570220.1 hypothetical protein [Calothrix sp. UHCC 0171]